MSFGLLKHVKELKNKNLKNEGPSHFTHLILGQDLGAVLKLLELRKQNPKDSIRLISSRALSRQMLIENYEFGLLQLRSQEAVEAVYKKFHDAKILPQKEEPSFYKDGKFHDFGGRAKPMELGPGEDYFLSKGYRLELQSLFTPEDWEHLDSILTEHQEIRLLEAIEKTQASDLIDQNEWSLSFKDYGFMTAQNLYISLSPKKFLSTVEHKENLTSDLIDFCSSAQSFGGISVTWKLDKEIFSEDKTLFIPQSMTHEWGHFLVEFHDNFCHILFFVPSEEPQADELGSKIRLMKRVLDRVFPQLENHITQEFIRFDEEMFLSQIKDTTLEQISFDYPTLHFIGQSGQLNTNLSQEKYLTRVLLN